MGLDFHLCLHFLLRCLHFVKQVKGGNKCVIVVIHVLIVIVITVNSLFLQLLGMCHLLYVAGLLLGMLTI